MTFTWEKIVDKFTVRVDGSNETFDIVVYQDGDTDELRYETSGPYICRKIKEDEFKLFLDDGESLGATALARRVR